MVHPSPSSSAWYPPSPLRASTAGPAPIPITSPPASSSPGLVSLHPCSSPTEGYSIPRGSYSRSVSLSTSPGVSLAYGHPAGGAKDSGRRRRSSSGVLGSSLAGGSSAARSLGAHSSSFAGSYEANLLSFRFSTPPSAPVPFILKLTASNTLSAKPPSPLCLPFQAHFFPLADPDPPVDVVGLSPPRHRLSSPTRTPTAAPAPESTPTTPYVASIDLFEHYTSLPFPTQLPAFPGHPIPPAGQIQAVISNPTGMGVKVYVVPYDVRGMPVGHRMVLRQNLFEEGGASDQRKLRASAVFHICCVQGQRARSTAAKQLSQSVPLASGESDVAAAGRTTKYYLHSTIRLVFSTLPSTSPADGPTQPTSTRTVVDMGSPTQGPARFIPWADAEAADYQALRQMRKVAIKRHGLPLAADQPTFASPTSILGLRAPPTEPSSFPLPRPAEAYALPPLARDKNHDLLPSPSLRPSPLPPARHDAPAPAPSASRSPLAFAKVRSAAQSGRSSPVPPNEESELSRRMRSLRVDQPGR